MDLRVPLSDIDMGEEEIESVVNVLKSKWLSMGSVTQEFEQKFSEYLGVQHSLAVSNGTAALHIAMRALGIGPGDEVIVPSLTFVASVNVVLYVGAKPVFADITSLDDFNISPADIEQKITPMTKAIIVVHYGGYPVDMDVILKIARDKGLYVIEDAAHAPGAELNGKKLGTIGKIGCFSFFSNKNLVTGEGGMIVTNDSIIAERIKKLRSHGMTSLSLERFKGHAYTYDVEDLGYNYRSFEIASALGLIQLQKLNRNNDKRSQIVSKYIKRLKTNPYLHIPFINHKGYPAFHLFPVLVHKDIPREELMTSLREMGIQTSIHYPAVHLFSYHQKRLGTYRGMLPITEEITQRELSLPLYPTMTDDDVSLVIEKLKHILQNIRGS
jgi:dTDP-4-amino-4,6-dideoxygalactose transaminase